MRVYIASPYTIGDVAINVRRSIEAANRVAEAGHFPFVPLLTHFWHMMFPHEYEFWLCQDNEWLAVCDALIRLEGESHGADMEVEMAKARGLKVFYSVEEFLNAEAE
jgi:hypothetical protein